MRDYRNLAAVVLALVLMQIALGVLAVAVPLALDAHGSSTIAIGFVAAAYAAGFMAGATSAPHFLARVGHIRAFAFFAAFAAALTLLLYAQVGAWSWAVVRFGIGMCAAGLFTAGESWIASAAAEERRGALLGFYHVASKAALVIGAVALVGADVAGPTAYMIAGGALALCLAPVAATRQAQPAPPSAEPFGLRRLLALAPAAVYAATGAGLVNGAVLGLSPVYAAASSATDPAGAAAFFYAALMIGGVISQFPAGALSDRVDRRLVVGALAAVAAAASFALALTPPGAPRAVSVTFALIWGGGALSFYGIAVAHAIDRAPRDQHPSVMAGLLIVWAAGSVAGPVLAGLMMQAGLGGAGLFVYAGLALAGLAFLMARRSAAREAVRPAERERFVTVQASSIAAADLDPRAQTTVSSEEEGAETGVGADADPPLSDAD